MDNQAAQDQQDNSAAQEQAQDWTTGLTAEQRTVVESKGWKAPGDSITSYVQLEKLVGQDKIVMPKKDANGEFVAEDFTRVMGQLGLPKDPGGYKESPNFKLPEGVQLNDKFVTEFRAECHKAGMLPKQYAFVMDKLAMALNQGTQSQKEAQEKAFNEASVALRTKWGEGYESKVALAQKAFDQFAGKDAKDRIAQKVGNDPDLLEWAANIADNLSEESLTRSNMAGNMMTPEAAIAEIDKLKAEHVTELTRDDHPQHAYFQKKMDDLYRIAYGQTS